MEETGVPGGNHRPTASNWWNFSHIGPLPSPGIELGPQRCEAKWAKVWWEWRLSSPSYRGPRLTGNFGHASNWDASIWSDTILGADMTIEIRQRAFFKINFTGDTIYRWVLLRKVLRLWQADTVFQCCSITASPSSMLELSPPVCWNCQCQVFSVSLKFPSSFSQGCISTNVFKTKTQKVCVRFPMWIAVSTLYLPRLG